MKTLLIFSILFSGAAVFSQTKATESKKAFLSQRSQLFKRAKKAKTASLPYRCKEIPGVIEQSAGGCLVKEQNLVYGPSENINDSITYSNWSNPLAAYLKCASSRRGQFFNWRLPTKQEFYAISEYYEELGINRAYFHWSLENPAIAENGFSVNKSLVRKMKSRGYSEKLSNELIINKKNQMFHPQIDMSNSVLYGKEDKRLYEQNIEIFKEAQSLFENAALVAPSSYKSFELNQFSTLSVDFILSWDEVQLKRNSNKLKSPCRQILGLCWKSEVEFYNWQEDILMDVPGQPKRKEMIEKNIKSLNNSFEVFPFDNIGLFCVRDIVKKVDREK